MKSTRIPLWFGVLKIRHREQLLYEERHGQVPVWAIGNYCLAWWANEAQAGGSNPVASWMTRKDKKAAKPADPPVEKHREPVVFMVGLRNGAWTIEFEGEYFGPCPTKEAAIDAAYLMAVDAAARGFDPCVQLAELPQIAGARTASGLSRSDNRARAA